MEQADRVFVALIATLFLAVLVVEGRNRWKSVRAEQRLSLTPPKGGRLLSRSNVPTHREHTDIVSGVAAADQP